jgi:hypothetical protein
MPRVVMRVGTVIVTLITASVLVPEEAGEGLVEVFG